MSFCEARPDLVSFIRVEEEVLLSNRQAAGLDGAVVATVHVHVQPHGVLVRPVKVDAHPDDVLGVVEVIVDPVPLLVIRIIEVISLAPPARVGIDVVVQVLSGMQQSGLQLLPDVLSSYQRHKR